MGNWDIFRCQYGCCRLPMRFIVALLIVFGIIVCVGHRIVFNIALTEMVVPSNKTKNQACPQYAKSAAKIKLKGGRKKWNQNVQALLLAMFFPGYVLSHLFGGFISDRWGSRWVLLIGITVSGLVTFLTPDMVLKKDWKVVAGSRFVVGFGQGIIFPATTSFMQQWIPESHRATIGGILYASGALGHLAGHALTAIVIGYWKSWMAGFAFWGSMAVIWVQVAFLYLFSFPESHAFISPMEEQFLQDEIGKRSKRPLPIRKVLSSCPVWALVAGTVSHDILLFTMSTSLEKYTSQVLNFSHKENAIASSIPLLMMFFTSTMFGLLSDFFVKNNANITLVRKSVALFSTIFPCAFLMAGTYSNCNRVLAITFLGLAMITKAAGFASISVNCLDLTTSHAGFIMGLSRGLGSITGFLSAATIGLVVKDNTLEQWHIVLWGFSGISLFFQIFFVIFGSGERANWDYLPREYDALPPKTKTKWYLQLSPEEFQEKQKLEMAAAARREAGFL